MAHRLALILVEPTFENTPEERAHDLLAPFSESNYVPCEPYRCACVGAVATQEVEAQVSMELGDFAWHRELFKARYDLYRRQVWEVFAPTESQSTEELFALAWTEFYAPREAHLTALHDVHPLRNTPNPKCTDCGGTGLCTEERNPHGLWDFYTLNVSAIVPPDVVVYASDEGPEALLRGDDTFDQLLQALRDARPGDTVVTADLHS